MKKNTTKNNICSICNREINDNTHDDGICKDGDWNDPTQQIPPGGGIYQ